MNNKNNEKPQTNMIGAGLAIGVGVGLAIGSAMGNPGAGLAIGIALGFLLVQHYKTRKFLNKMMNNPQLEIL